MPFSLIISKYGLAIDEVFHCPRQIYQNLNTSHAENPPKTAEKTRRLAGDKTLILTAKKAGFRVFIRVAEVFAGR